MSMSKGANLPVQVPAVRAVLGWRSGAGIPDADGSALLLACGRLDAARPGLSGDGAAALRDG